MIHTDVLVIGSGAAGLCAAIEASHRQVLVLSAADPESSTSTALAQGGMAAPLGAGDSVSAHVADTLAAGGHSCSRKAAINIISRAGQAVAFLERTGVNFDRQGTGWELHLEAGHSRPRVLHVGGDRSGRGMLRALLAHAGRCSNIDCLTGYQAVALLQCSGGGIAGVLAVDGSGRTEVIAARDTVLATGGLGGFFPFTTNGRHAQGDGLAMALARGARVSGIEFVQFHPTALLAPEDPLPLLTEALRGAGAFLVDDAGRRFMSTEHPLADLAPRDVVARAVWNKRMRSGAVWLDARAVFGSERWKEFPAALETCAAHGIDPRTELIPVTAAAHYHMGGVVVDPAGRASLPGLWACGEVACTGIHGANRLASNSLLEAVVCGRTVGLALNRSRSIRRVPLKGIAAPAPAQTQQHLWPRVRSVIGRCMGPLRNAEELTRGLRDLRSVREEIDPACLILRQRIDLALAMVTAALARRESRGAHFRCDFPQRDAEHDTDSLLRHPVRTTPSQAECSQQSSLG